MQITFLILMTLYVPRVTNSRLIEIT